MANRLVLGEVTANGDQTDEITRGYQTTVAELSVQYYEKIKAGNTNEARQVLSRIDELLSAAQAYLSPGATAKEAAENAGKRYVYVYSSDPTVLEELVDQAVSAEQVSQNIGNLIIGNSAALANKRDRAGQLLREQTRNRQVEQAIDQAMDDLRRFTGDFDQLEAGQKALHLEALRLKVQNAIDSAAPVKGLTP